MCCFGGIPRAPQTLEQLEERDLSCECPHCGHTVRLIPLHAPVNDLDERSYFVAHCPNQRNRYCKPIFAVYEALNNYVREVYPIRSLDAGSVHESVPEAIREDYAESKRCFFAKAYKGAVVMCRRATEAVACDKLGDQARNAKGEVKKLWQLIDAMFEAGLIIRSIKDSAREIRLFGNYGAHVQDDGLDSVDRDEAEAAIKLTSQLLHAIYIAPYQTEALRQSRESK